MSIGKNTALGLVADAAIAGLGLALSVMLTHSLTVHERGVYSILITTNVLLSSIASLGLGAAASTYLARGQYTIGEVNGVALLLALGMGALCAIGTSLVFPLLQYNVFDNVPFGYLLIALLLVAATIYQNYWSAIMVGLSQLALLYRVNVIVNIASALLMMVVVGLFQLGLPGFLASWSFSTLAWFATILVLGLRLERPVMPRRAVLRDLVGFGLRGHGNNIAQQVALRFDVYTVNPLIGTSSVAFYSLATNLAEKLWVPVNAIQAASLGKIAQLPREESALLTAKIARTALLLMLSAAIPFAAVSPWLVPILFTDPYSASVLPLCILLIGTNMFAVMWVLQNYIVGQMQRPGLLSILAWIQLAFSIPAYIGLIIWLGIVGAAIASTLTYAIAMIGTLTIFLRDSGLPVSAVLIPRRSDFQDYARLLRGALSRFRRKPPQDVMVQLADEDR